MTRLQLHLVGYDVAADARRARCQATVRGHAIGGQKSLYECWLPADAADDLHAELGEVIDHDTDRVVIVRLDPRATMHALGAAVPPPAGRIFYCG